MIKHKIKSILTKELNNAKFFYEYCIAYDKQVVIPKLQFRDTQLYRDHYPEFKPLIDKYKDLIVLPYNLRYE